MNEDEVPPRADVPPDAHFGQRYGGVPMPEFMQFGEISRELNTELRDVMDDLLEINEFFDPGDGDGEWFKEDCYKVGVENALIAYFKKTAGWTTSESREKISNCKVTLEGLKYSVRSGWSPKEILDFFEYLFDWCPPVIEDVKKALKECRAPYCLLEEYCPDKERGFTRFHPITLQEEREAITASLATLDNDGYHAATKHLTKASKALDMGDYEGCTLQSIHAVESVAKVIAGAENASLGKALSILKKNNVDINPTLERGWKKLFGFSSHTVRHGKYEIRHIDDPDKKVDIDQPLAMYMFGACASFAAYLVNKKREIDEGVNPNEGG